MKTLYPAIKPYAEYELKVDNIHTLYLEECGSPKGSPILFLHGGPGAGCTPEHRRFFDPEKYRIILFDQRGCGRSTPHGELKNNNTPILLQDIEEIRNYLKVDKWLLFGGSWGSTLALLYAELYPIRVIGMILRGVFLCRKKDLAWFYNEDGAARIYPDEWQKLIEQIEPSKKNNLISAYYEVLNGADEVAKMYAAKAWARWEAACSTLDPCLNTVQHFSNLHTAISLAKIECHYFLNDIFMEENYIMNNISKISKIPGIIIHGRYDMVCPLDNACALHQAWEGSELQIIRNAGHSSMEPGIISALVNATNRLVN
jgi:proline iminopeptidase